MNILLTIAQLCVTGAIYTQQLCQQYYVACMEPTITSTTNELELQKKLVKCIKEKQ